MQAAEVREALADNAQSAEQTVTMLVENIVRNLGRIGTLNGTSKSAKIPDPPLLTDGKEPTFDNWRIQVNGKLEVNTDHFATEQACMTYVFGRTSGDA